MISIIIPVYNVVSYLHDCIQSVVSQSFSDWECILVDDGSFDGSEDVCDYWGNKESRIRVIHQPNQGVSAARNTGLSIIKGDYVTFIDSDDWVDRLYLERLYSTRSNGKVDLSICGLQQVYTNGKTKAFSAEDNIIPLDRDHESDFVQLNQKYLLFGPVIKLYKSSIIKNNTHIRFEEGCSYGEDLIFNYRYLEHVNTIAVIPDILYNYRIANSGSLSRINDDSRFEREYSQWHMLKDFFDKKGYISEVSRDFLFDRLWGIVYDGVFRFPRFKKGRIDYLKGVLTIPEIYYLKGYGDPTCSKWIKFLILHRMYRSFYLYFKILG